MAAFIGGVLGTKQPIPAAICSTGNCTWPVTPTLGLCSACEDVRSQVFKTGNLSDWGNSLRAENGLNYTLVFDSNVTMSNSLLSNSSNGIELNLQPESLWRLAAAIPNGTEMDFRSGRQDIVEVWALGLPASSFVEWERIKPDTPSTSIDPLIVGHKCRLSFCLQAHNASSINGAFKQQLLETWDQMDVHVPSGFSPTSWNDKKPAPLWSFQRAPESMNARNSSAYTIDWLSRHILANELVASLGGTVGISGFFKRPGFGAQGLGGQQGGGTAGGAGGAGGGGGAEGNDLDAAVIEAMWMASNSTNDLSQKFQQIANAYSAYMQTALAAPFDARFAPAASRESVFVVVRWRWLAYPLSLVLGGYVFFVATVFQTRRRAVKPWKSQRLPLLFAEVDGVMRELAEGSLHRCDGLEGAVGKVKVRLRYDGRDALAFERVEGPNLRKRKVVFSVSTTGTTESSGLRLLPLSPSSAESTSPLNQHDGPASEER